MSESGRIGKPAFDRDLFNRLGGGGQSLPRGAEAQPHEHAMGGGLQMTPENLVQVRDRPTSRLGQIFERTGQSEIPLDFLEHRAQGGGQLPPALPMGVQPHPEKQLTDHVFEKCPPVELLVEKQSHAFTGKSPHCLNVRPMGNAWHAGPVFPRPHEIHDETMVRMVEIAATDGGIPGFVPNQIPGTNLTPVFGMPDPAPTGGHNFHPLVVERQSVGGGMPAWRLMIMADHLELPPIGDFHKKPDFLTINDDCFVQFNSG